jgi:hypothetical protein
MSRTLRDKHSNKDNFPFIVKVQQIQYLAVYDTSTTNKTTRRFISTRKATSQRSREKYTRQDIPKMQKKQLKIHT